MMWIYVWFHPVNSSILNHLTPAQVEASPPEEPLLHIITATTTSKTCRPVSQTPPSARRTARPPQQMELWTQTRMSRVVSHLTPHTTSGPVKLCPRILYQPLSGTVHPCPHIPTLPCPFLSLTPMLMGREQRPLACEGKKHQR